MQVFTVQFDTHFFTTGANLCHASSLGTLDGYTYTHNVGINPNDTGEYTASYEEKLEFDISIEDPNAGKLVFQMYGYKSDVGFQVCKL